MSHNPNLLQPQWSPDFISTNDVLEEAFESLHIYIGNLRNDLDGLEGVIEDLECMSNLLPNARLGAIEKTLKELSERINIPPCPHKDSQKPRKKK